MIDYPWRYVQTHIQSSVGTHNNNVHGIMESPVPEEMVGGITLFSYPYIFSFIEYGTGKLTGLRNEIISFIFMPFSTAWRRGLCKLQIVLLVKPRNTPLPLSSSVCYQFNQQS